MAMVNVSRATQTLASPAFLKTAVLIVAGSILASVLTNYARSNVYDVSVTGGDAVYAAVAALLTLTVVPGVYGRNMALGMGASGVRVLLSEFGVI